MNTRIDFHSNVSDQLQYAYRLVRKALNAQCNLVVCIQNQSQLAEFDQLLWQFSSTDFLPHVVLNQGQHPLAHHTPIWLTLYSESAACVAGRANEVLVNLSDEVPTHFTQFERLIEIVSQDELATQAGRQRYRFYQQQGYQPNHIHAK